MVTKDREYLDIASNERKLVRNRWWNGRIYQPKDQPIDTFRTYLSQGLVWGSRSDG